MSLKIIKKNQIALLVRGKAQRIWQGGLWRRAAPRGRSVLSAFLNKGAGGPRVDGEARLPLCVGGDQEADFSTLEIHQGTLPSQLMYCDDCEIV